MNIHEISRELLEVESAENVIKARKDFLRKQLFELLDQEVGNGIATSFIADTGRRIGRFYRKPRHTAEQVMALTKSMDFVDYILQPNEKLFAEWLEQNSLDDPEPKVAVIMHRKDDGRDTD